MWRATHGNVLLLPNRGIGMGRMLAAGYTASITEESLSLWDWPNFICKIVRYEKDTNSNAFNVTEVIQQ